MSVWEPGSAGILVLPSGRRVRGRGLRHGLPSGPEPDLAIHLLAHPPDAVGWESRWVRWRDFRLPEDPQALLGALLEAWHRSLDERVEIACVGGRGRTGTALACLAVIDGLPSERATDYVREHYHPRAVETPWQRRFVARFSP